jgi:uncharacterized RDD family membrane protein YckC
MGIRVIKTNGQPLDNQAVKHRYKITFVYIIFSLLGTLSPNNYYYPVRDMLHSYFNVTIEQSEIPLVAFMLIYLFDFSVALFTKKHQGLRDQLTETWVVKAGLKPSYYESKPSYQD